MAAKAVKGAERIGLFGGTFDPPHIGHAIVAQDLVEGLALDRLLVVPSPRPPHRAAVLDPEVRASLVERMFRDLDTVEVTRIEFGREGPSWTVDTLAAVGREHPGAELVLVIGADQLAAIDTWHRFRELPERATVAVMHREGESPALPDGVGEFPYITVDVTRVDLSASTIRERLGTGRSIRFLVPEPIREEIERAWRDGARAQRASTEC